MQLTQEFIEAICDRRREDKAIYRECDWTIYWPGKPNFEMRFFLKYYRIMVSPLIMYTKARETRRVNKLYRIRYKCDFYSIHAIVCSHQLLVEYEAHVHNQKKLVADAINREIPISCKYITDIIIDMIADPKYVVHVINNGRRGSTVKNVCREMYSNLDAIFFDNVHPSDLMCITIPWYNGRQMPLFSVCSRYSIYSQD